jgi:hypothetical protein
MEATTTMSRHEHTIDRHRTRGETRLINGEWSAYVFVDPITVEGDASPDSARGALAKALRAVADDLDREVDG